MDLAKILGAAQAASLQRFSLYLPDSDREGRPVPQLEQWIEAAMLIFAEVNGGATRLPLAQGIWKPEDGGATVREATTIVYSFIRDTERFEGGIERLAAFIHTFGKHANQGEVMVEFSGDVPGRGYVSRAYFIADYSKAGERPF
ncbi:MAG TPA: hypothetical protein VGB04_09910 [Allosphingosinicella sp.]|jgi:hypothetical protein